MNPKRLISLLLCSAILWPGALSAFGRDADGSRMQARPLNFKATASDRLSPPTDSVDWRYVRLATAVDATVTVTANPKNVPVTVVVTDAMGKSIARGRTNNGTFTTRRRFDPGLYYISVTSSRAVSYQLSVR